MAAGVSLHVAYTIACPYCAAGRGERCRSVMLPTPVVLDEPHPTRIAFAEEVPF